jgi:hypothetical protein
MTTYPIRSRLGMVASFALWSLCFLLSPRRAALKFREMCQEIAAKEPLP